MGVSEEKREENKCQENKGEMRRALKENKAGKERRVERGDYEEWRGNEGMEMSKKGL